MDIHIGVYLEIISPVKRSKVDLCENHNRSDRDVFCSKCGRHLDNRYQIKTKVLADKFFHEEKVDRFFITSIESNKEPNKETYIAISNSYGGGSTCLSTSLEDKAVIDIPDSVQEEKKFWEKHSEDVEFLRELGCEVLVKYGIVKYIPY